jgi:Fe-S-cluster containining protein
LNQRKIDMTKPLQEKFERTFCACDLCKAGCKTMPGSLAPGDLKRISDYLGMTPDQEQFPDTLDPEFMKNFVASEGSLVKRNGEYIRIPSIVPAQKPDGRCVFLSSKDMCTISPVSPFGCSQFNACEGPERVMASTSRVHAMLNAIMADVGYLIWWGWLKAKGMVAKPLKDRRVAYEKAIEKLS